MNVPQGACGKHLSPGGGDGNLGKIFEELVLLTYCTACYCHYGYSSYLPRLDIGGLSLIMLRIGPLNGPRLRHDRCPGNGNAYDECQGPGYREP